MKIELISYNWKGNRHQISIPDDSSDFERMMFEHCCECFDNPEIINDSQKNRDLMTKVLNCHGFNDVIFVDPLIKNKS
jgi:hypothetical protein